MADDRLSTSTEPGPVPTAAADAAAADGQHAFWPTPVDVLRRRVASADPRSRRVLRSPRRGLCQLGRAHAEPQRHRAAITSAAPGTKLTGGTRCAGGRRGAASAMPSRPRRSTPCRRSRIDAPADRSPATASATTPQPSRRRRVRVVRRIRRNPTRPTPANPTWVSVPFRGASRAPAARSRPQPKRRSRRPAAVAPQPHRSRTAAVAPVGRRCAGRTVALPARRHARGTSSRSRCRRSVSTVPSPVVHRAAPPVAQPQRRSAPPPTRRTGELPLPRRRRALPHARRRVRGAARRRAGRRPAADRVAGDAAPAPPSISDAVRRGGRAPRARAALRRVVRETVAGLVSTIAERLVREEIERIKASINSSRLSGMRVGLSQSNSNPQIRIDRLMSVAVVAAPRSGAPAAAREARARRARSEVDAALGSGRRLPLRPHASARRGLLDRHAAADRQRLAARRPRLLLHPHRRRSRASSGCAARPCSIRWGGTTTACRPSAACRTTTACAAIRRCRTTRRSRRRRSRRKQPISVSRPNFIELCDAADGEDEQVFERCGSTLGLSVDWSMTYATIGRARAARLAARVPAPAAARPRLPGRGADAVGRRLPDRGRAGRARGSRACPARITASGSRRRPDGGGVVEIETTRPELIPACVALVAHPDDERYQPLFGTDVDDAAVRRARAGAGAPARRSREGQRHRDDLHVRRHHRRDLVARAEPAGARDHPAGRHAARRSTWGAAGWESADAGARAAALRRARAAVGGEGAREDRRAAARVAAIWSASRGRSRTR